MKELLMGNEAVAMGAIAAGVRVVAGYPGTPSTEVLETIAKKNDGSIHVEWSTNEKAALEVAAGASYAGARSLVTMKQVGLNVALDPLMSLNYVGIKGGMIVYVADDPGPISSQTEQDTRRFSEYGKIVVFDPSSPLEAYNMVEKAFNISEKYEMPVILRSTTRICHSCAVIDVKKGIKPKEKYSFEKDNRFVIFPKLSYQSKIRIMARESKLSDEFYDYNEISGIGSIGIACGGVSYAYVLEALKDSKDFTVFKVNTFPMSEKKAVEFLESVDSVIVFEELDCVIEDLLVRVCGKYNIKKEILGKRNDSVITAGELSPMLIGEILDNIYHTRLHLEIKKIDKPETPKRPPVLCAGCPHRASFYVVKQAMKNIPSIFCGDIGCYTLGNSLPLDMVDTCLCMGAGITIAQGLSIVDDKKCFAFIGDSTFFASGITGIANAIYNQNDIVIVVLDNSTTAMTGHQPHPGIGKTMMNEVSRKISIKAVLCALGIEYVKEVNPFDYKESIEIVKEASNIKGVKAIIFKAPCIALEKKKKAYVVEECIGCKKCIKEIGCPALILNDNKAFIDRNLCVGCGLCQNICPKSCIRREE